ncbi:MAG: EamA/RhaT family transporter [Deltaproteobacteria bacterium]|nr:MAG: EamA/RhaT family transporter [Deltaproteobacteria bacterium]
MKWFYLSLIAAFFTSLSDVFNKIVLKRVDEWIVIWLDLLVTIPFLLLFLKYFHFTLPSLDVFVIIAELLPMEIAAFYLYMKAIKVSPLSLTIPFLAFTPVFTILTACLILGENISPAGTVGVLLVSIGAYLLNGEEMLGRPLAPIKAIFKVPGSRYMLIVALIYAVTSTLGKKAVLLSDPFSFGLVYIVSQAIVLTTINAFRFARNRSLFGSIKDSNIWKFVLAAGCSMAIMVVAHFSAIQLAPVSYMISVKRLSLVISVLFGWLIFKEKHIFYRILGASLMMCGVVLLYLY